MTLRIQDAGTLREITRGKVMVAGVLRELREIKVQDGGTLRTVATFADPLTVTASPPTVSGTESSGGSVLITTNATTASPVGGRAPFTYSWALVFGTEGTPTAPTAATTAFRATLAPGSYESTFRVTVTDAVGQTATADVTATFFNIGGGIG